MMTEEIHWKLTLRLFSGYSQRSFGPGIAELLERVEEHKSLRSAAASMGMAYSKAWRIIRTAESVFGCKMLSTAIGGKNGGGAQLTPQARQLLESYRQFTARVESCAGEAFDDCFGFLREWKKEE